ncbi:MAG: hybrid sensor histidine kinase/response regulator [Spirochaetes bacterium]|nr:MAG: hybrid sensor histidine kinase/response regulator [Spirochaetota bacterium]RKX90028.1 MAG: hybrid sensor histidine kinase/response regulator [Spirochaetota bacterium]
MARAFNRLSFAGTMENFPEGIAFVGDGTEIKDCNETFRRMTGIGEGPLHRFDSLVHPSHFEAWSSGLSRFLSERSGTHRLILRLSRTKIPDRWVRLSFLPLNIPGEESFLLLANDITGQKRLEIKLIRARDEAEKATQSKSDFLANTSHEIRTPIHTIIGMSDLLADTTLDQEQADYLGQVRFAAEVLLTLINDILDFSKIEAGQLRLERTDFDLIDMLEDAVDLVTLEAHKKNVDVGLYIDSRVPSRVFGDPTRLRQVVVNLVNNAVKFTHEGQVVLDVETLSVGKDTVKLKFSVNDSGVGIPLEKQQNLFQAFHQADSSTTRQFGGTGLGLFISRNLVSQMGGVLSFSSEPGQGSSFFFEMDFDRADENVVLPVVPGDFFAGRRVLVVDDNDVIRDRISRTLSAWGFNVDEAGSAEEALFLIRSSDNKKYELVIVDQTMPHIDGWQFASEVHSDSGIVPPRMILMSMKGGVGAVEAKMKLLGWFDSYLTKPIRQSDLSASVFRLLSSDMDLEEAEDLEEIESVGEDETLTSTAGFRILIAEDHEVNRKLLQTILEKNGHQVLEAPNGKVAYEVVAREKPDLVFMDCQMPVMNGYESTERIRKGGYEAPVIAVTASALAEEREKCLNCGMSDLVTKPFKQTDILMMIERYLGIGKRLIPKVENKPVETGMAVFDYAAAVDTFLGNEELVRSLLRPQMEKMEGEVKMIRDAVSGKDWETVRTTAHSIKGSCRNMDMNRCGEAAAVLEAAGKNTDEQGAVAALPRLEAEFPLLKAEVEKILSS